MPDRRRQIELLVATRFDYIPISSSRDFASTKPGTRPSRYAPCRRCGGHEVIRDGIRIKRVSGTGTIRDRFGREQPCEGCNGKGNVPWDDYTEVQVVTEADEPTLGDLIARDTRHVTCPDCQDLAGISTGVIRGKPCRRCKGTGEAAVPGSWLSTPRKEPKVAIDGRDSAFATSIDRRDELADWHQLEKAMAAIHRTVNKPLRYLALTLNAKQATDLLDEVNLCDVDNPDQHHARTQRAYLELTMFERALYDLAVDYIDSQMPDPIRVPAGAAANLRDRAARPLWAKGQALNEHERKRRDDQARRWEREGKPRSWIGQQTGLSDRQLREVLNGKGVAA